MRRYIDPKVLSVINAVGVPIISFGEMIAYGHADFGMIMNMGMAAGLYDSQRDLVAINENALLSVRCSEVFLHEIVHATGHPRRLARPSIVDQLRGVRHDRATYDTEEATAQLGMFKLAVEIGLDRNLHETLLLRYLPNFPHANFDQAERESDQAVKFILGLMRHAHDVEAA